MHKGHSFLALHAKCGHENSRGVNRKRKALGGVSFGRRNIDQTGNCNQIREVIVILGQWSLGERLGRSEWVIFLGHIIEGKQANRGKKNEENR